ncbi:MAG: hypothetical protein JXQ27_05540 [Acidobacteria bacterium]|nr:hypothetical protein [Acidobacteriota bacterium]
MWRRIKAMLGYSWAALALPLVLATFIGMNGWARGLAAITGVKISPWFSGGDVVRTVEEPGYRVLIREPVFQALVGERDEGFVQIDWVPTGETLPAQIRSDIDVWPDGSPEFTLHLDTVTNEVRLEQHSPLVLGAGRVLNLGQSRAVRVELRNPR